MGINAICELWHLVMYCTDIVKSKPKNYGRSCQEENVIIIKELNESLKEIAIEIGEKTNNNYDVRFVEEQEVLVAQEDPSSMDFPKLLVDDLEFEIKIRKPQNRNTDTKTIVVPSYEGDLNDDEIEPFFHKSRIISDCVCEVIGGAYFNSYFEKGFKFSELTSYNLYTFVIGGESSGFDAVIKNANDKEEMRKIVKYSEGVRKSLNILRKVVDGSDNEEEYSWFSENQMVNNQQEPKAIFAFRGTEIIGTFIGLTHGNPHDTTQTFLSSII